MKRLLSNRKRIYIAILILFIVGQLTGTLVIRQLFLNYKLKDNYPQAVTLAQRIAVNEDDVTYPQGMIVKAYQLDGQTLATAAANRVLKLFLLDEEQFRQQLTAYIPDVIQQQPFAIIRNIGGLPSDSVVVAAPVVRDGQTIGVIFLLQPIAEFQAVLNGFYLVFTATLLLGTIVIGYFLSAYVKEVRRLDKLRSDYVANISHELNSPIASIRALTETLADGMVQQEEKRRNYYSIILTECGRLQRLIGDVLELSRMQNNPHSPERQRIDMVECMQFVQERYAFLAEDLGIDFQLTKSALQLPDAYGNRDKLLQLLNILLDNAMKFVGEEGIIQLDAVVEAKQIVIMITDNGEGIASQDLPYIFERFYKSDKSHPGNGSGLGLSIASEIADSLGEKISVTSRPGEGSTFRFTIKRAADK